MMLRLAWLVWAGAVAAASLMPARSPVIEMLGRVGLNDKLEHFAAYAVLGALPALEAFGSLRQRAGVIGFVVVLGGVLEVLQNLSPGRSCDWRDFAADAAGVLAGMVCVRVWGLGR